MTQNLAKTSANVFKEKLQKEISGESRKSAYKLYHLTSDSQFFELLYFHGKSAPVTIGDTLIFENSSSAVKYWLFNPKGKLRKKYQTVLRKNKDHTTSLESLIMEFTGLTSEELFPQKGSVENVKDEKLSYYLRVKGTKEGFLGNHHDLRYFFFEKPGMISVVQQVLDIPSSKERTTNETIMAEYTREDRVNPPLVKLYKKSINYKKLQTFLYNRKQMEPGLSEKMSEGYLSCQLNGLKGYYSALLKEKTYKDSLSSLSSINRKHTIPGLFDTELFFLKDIPLQNALSKEMISIVTFIESTFLIHIATFTAKFGISEETGRPVFMGAGDCYFYFKSPEIDEKMSREAQIGPDRVINSEVLIIKCGSREFREDILPVKPHTDTSGVLPDIVNKYSQKLLTTMLKDKCEGDFCKYKIIQSYEENLLVLNDAINQDGIPANNRLPGSVMGKDLHFTIYYNLILRTRKNPEFVINLLRNNNFVPDEKYSKESSVALIPLIEYEFYNNSKHHDNDIKETKGDYKYRQCKVCPRCFTVYQILQKQLDSTSPTQALARTTPNFRLQTNGSRKGSMAATGGFAERNNGTKGGPSQKDVKGEGEEITQETYSFLQKVAKILGLNSNFDDILASNKMTLKGKNDKSALQDIAQQQTLKEKSGVTKAQMAENKESREPSQDFKPSQPLPQVKITKPRNPIKRDNANESDDSAAELNRRYTNERLLYGMQISYGKSDILKNQAEKVSDQGKGSLIGKYLRSAVLSAGADNRFFKKDVESCMAEVEAYRMDAYEKTKERQMLDTQEIMRRIHQARIDQASYSGAQFLANGRKMKRKTTLNIGSSNMVKFDTGEQKEVTQDERAVYQRLNRKAELVKGFLAESATRDQQGRMLCVQQYKYQMKFPPFNHSSTFKLFPQEEDYLIFDRHALARDIPGICTALQVPCPDIPSTGNIIGRVFVFNDMVAIPYLILNTPLEDDQTKIENIIVFHDMFDNMFLSLPLYTKLLEAQRNKRIILFHYPGQAYTYFDRNHPISNEYMSIFIDSFFYHLEDKQIVDFRKQRFKFVGIGFGGNALLCYLSSLSETYGSMRHVLLINTFASVNQALKDFVGEFLHELSKSRLEDVEFPFYFFQYISRCTKPHKTDEVSRFYENNPISIEGRKTILKGVLASVPLEKRTSKIYLPMYIVHSLTNCLVDISHADAIEKVEVGGAKGLALPDSSTKRKIIYLEGGHDVFADNPTRVTDLLQKFLLKR